MPPSPSNMSSPRTIWTQRTPDPETVEGLRRKLSVPSIVATLLVNRGLAEDEAELHLTPDLARLHSPALLPGMSIATERLARAIDQGETILVHGDYDVDGVTGSTLLMKLFDHLGAKAVWHIPNRFTDGYSFGDHSIRRAQEVNAKVVVSVDNGTSAGETIAELAELGIDTIVTDHHEPPLGDLPVAIAIVNPKLKDSGYPFRELCGGAVAFKLAWGLCQQISGGDRVRSDLRDFLVEAMSLVAIATVCDVVPLVEENRILASFGLRSLSQSSSPGVRALLKVAKLTDRRLSGEDVGFQIGPRINASGRLGSAETAVELLLAKTDSEAAELASTLDDMNVERKRIERELLEEALQQAEEFQDIERWPVMVLAGQGWHQGVIGIVAARMVTRYARPALVIGLDGEEGRGSARSVPGFSVLQVMHAGADQMMRYGGHAAAAGCEVKADQVPALREALCNEARRLLGGGAYPPAELSIDCEMSFAHWTPELMRQVDRLEPYGEANEKPIFLSRDMRLAEPPRRVGQARDHLALQLRCGMTVLRAMAFGMGHRADELEMGLAMELVYTPRWNTFRGTTNLEIGVHDFRTERTP
ncbi:MAG: single-stranded-DNA-specific exonuclease [Planctomycetota bacterium]|jgi:single-stranded-DNA-specific exonuclease